MPNLFDARDTYATSIAFLVTRDELPLLLNARQLFGCGVEVGVKEGEFSAHLLTTWHGSHLISVDPWLSDEAGAYVDIANVSQNQHDHFHQTTVARLQPFGARSTIWRSTSLDASGRIPRHSLDFVYLDARHDYASVLEDLEAWYDKVRPGGILAGHDYLDGNLTAGVFGVRSAVDEFFGQRGLRVCATLDDEPWISWIVEIPPPAALFAGAEFADSGELDALAGRAPEPSSTLVAVPNGSSNGAIAGRGTATTDGTPTAGNGRDPGSNGAGPPAGERLPNASADSSGPAAASASAASTERLIGLNVQTDEIRHELKFVLDPEQMSQRIMLDGFEQNQMYEPETSTFFAGALRPGDTFIDIGTHVGYFSLLAAALVGPSGRVISFEPEAENYRRLKLHVAMNRFGHVEAVNAAVGDSPGSAQLFVNQDNDGGHALWDVGAHPFNVRSRNQQTTAEVEVTSLDHYLRDRDLGSLKLIKIDTEGSEHRILQGARETLTRFRVPFVVAEINEFALQQMGTSGMELRAWMEELGYETFVFLPGETNLVRLRLDQTVQSNHVYNLLFRHPDAPALGAAA
ncbi:MAG TPA: FkbM family methyltransferase [Longimicrobiaceae bacterium]|nr:FkbM family methyltransferase [Longimicrobiaceae bacterium]